MTHAESIRALRRSGDHEGACALAIELARAASQDAETHFEAACVHDYLGREAQAIPFYRTAITLGLAPEQLRSAYLGLGSTYRTLGQYQLAEQVLREGLSQFEGAAEIRAFLAMTLHNLGQPKQAVEMLLGLLAETSADTHLRKYREAIQFYAQDIERAWPKN